MAKVTWLGEDELHHRHTETGEVVVEAGGPSFTTWNGTKFPKGVAVEVTNEMALTKARGNKYFKVEDDAKAKAHEPQTQQAPQHVSRGHWDKSK